MESISTIHLNNKYLYFDKTFPKYLLDSNKNLLLGQLFDFQIHHLCEHVNVSIFNEFGSILPNKLLIQALLEKITDNQIFDCEHCKTLGIGKLPLTKNKFVFNNIGGKPQLKIELDASQNFIPSIKTDNIFKNSIESIEILIPIEDFLNAFEGTSFEDLSVSVHETTQKERKTIAKQHILMGTTTIERLGKIDNTMNSSYIDNVLMLYLLPLDHSFFNDALFIEQRIQKLNDLSFIHKLFNVKISKTEIKNKILGMNAIFKKYFDYIDEGIIITSQQFSIELQKYFDKPKGILMYPYFNYKKMYPIFDFYRDLLKINLIETDPYTLLTKTYISKDDPNLYSAGADLPQKAQILDQIIRGKNGATDHICFEINELIINYLIRRDQYRLFAPTNKKAYCFICNEYIDYDVFKKSHLNFHRQNNLILLSDLMNFQIDLIQDDVVPMNGFSTKIMDGKKVIYENTNPENAMTEIEAVSKSFAKKYERVIHEYLIKDTQCITFCINRLIKRVNKKTLNEETFIYKMKVHLEEEIVDEDSTTYQLNAIITKENDDHLLFFHYDKTWFVYNCKFNPEEQNDYIVPIGSFENLAAYSQEKVKTLGIMYIYLKINN